MDEHKYDYSVGWEKRRGEKQESLTSAVATAGLMIILAGILVGLVILISQLVNQ